MPDAFESDECLPIEELHRLSDELLMAFLRRGQGDALQVLFERYHRLVLHVMLKILHDVSEAEDAMQTLFMDIYRHAAQFDSSRGTAKMWILHAAYHRAINCRKQLLRRQYYANLKISAVEDTLPAPGLGTATSQEARDLVAKAFESLKPLQRKVIEMFYFEGSSLKEIAAQTGEHPDNVRHHYYRGLDRLRNFLCQAEEEQKARIGRKEISDARA